VIEIVIAEQVSNKNIRPVNRIELKLNQLDSIGHLHASLNKVIITNWLAELVNLKYFHLSGWDLSDPTLFQNSIYLEEITLDYSIGTVTSNIFVCLKSLRYLTIQGSDIIFVSDSLNGLQNLVFLDIHDAGLTTIPEGLFNGLINLTDLHFSLNRFTTLPEGVFKSLNNLKKLNLLRNA
jgi:Leucine-rich repeat (LRR) protein